MKISKVRIVEIIKLLYIISNICVFLKTFYFKFFININDAFFLIPPIVLWALYSLFGHVKLSTKQMIEILLIVLIISLQVISNGGVGITGQFVFLLSLCCLIASPISLKKELLEGIILIYTIICVISLIGWIAVCVLRFNIPYTYASYHGYTFYDYGIFNIRVEGIDFSRYLGMFLEPGYTGIMCVLLLIANGFDFKKITNVLLLVCTLATLSLASYILLVLYFIFQRHSLKLLFRIIAGIVIAAILLYIIHLTLYDMSWVLDYFIKRRLVRIASGNGILGSRFSNAFNNFYRDEILNKFSHLLFGYGSVRFLEYARINGIDSAGYRVYIAQFGIVNTFLVVIFYMIEIIKEKKYESISIFVIWVLSFIDIAYPTWGCFLIYVICIDAFMNSKESNDKPAIT